jgi:hypothetical protein
MPKNLYMIRLQYIIEEQNEKRRSIMIIGIENLKEKIKDKEDSE